MKKKKKDKNKLDPYKISPLSAIPVPIQVGIAKWWCYAAVYYFVGFGMPMLMTSVIDTIFTLGLVLGLVQTFVVSFVVKGICGKEEIYHKYLAVKTKSPFRILLYVLYGWVLTIFVAMTYQIINMLINSIMGYGNGVIKFGVEPLLFGVFMLVYDTAIIRLMGRISELRK